MLYKAIQKETGYPNAVAGFLSRLCCCKRYLPQRACTSPALSNICFKDCDAELDALAKRKGMAYSRYSDDIYLSSNNINARRLLNEAKKIILDHGFRVNGRKTKILRQHQAQEITAIIVNKKLYVTRDYRRRLSQEVYYLKKFEEKSKDAYASEEYLHYLYQLQGKVSFVLYVDPESKEFLDARKVLEDKISSCRYEYIPLGRGDERCLQFPVFPKNVLFVVVNQTTL